MRFILLLLLLAIGWWLLQRPATAPKPPPTALASPSHPAFSLPHPSHAANPPPGRKHAAITSQEILDQSHNGGHHGRIRRHVSHSFGYTKPLTAASERYYCYSPRH